jgi:spore coat polysaccharide biosynthesis predicted glycosyltransferase SpsG
LKILFRTSGGTARNKELGTGHIFRSINLAKQFSNHKKIFLVEDYGGVKKILQDNNISNIKFLKPDIPINEDYEKTMKIIKKEKIDLIIIDKIYTPKIYIKKLKKEIFTVYITDLFDYEFPANVVVNGFVGLKNEITSNKYNSKCLIGPSFQILSNKYENKLKMKKNNDLLITLGGYDANNIIKNLCSILPNFLEKMKIKIILGPITKRTNCLTKIENNFKNNLKIITYTDDLRKQILQSKFGLCSGGVTTYEFASLKVPFGIICQYKHQKITAFEWEKNGYGVNLGLSNKESIKRIEEFLNNFLENKINFRMKKICINGNGSKKVKNEILKLFKEQKSNFRK